MPQREVIEIAGLGHPGQPIPLAVRIGSMLYSGSINGTDPQTGKIAADPTQQIKQAFKNLRTVLERAGGELSGVAKVDVRLSDRSLRDTVNSEWIAMFPNEYDRPVRHSTEATLGGSQVIQLELIAHLNNG